MRYFQRLWYQKVVLFAEIKRNKADSLTPITQFHTPMVLTAFINLSLLKLTYLGQIDPPDQCYLKHGQCKQVLAPELFVTGMTREAQKLTIGI